MSGRTIGIIGYPPQLNNKKGIGIIGIIGIGLIGIIGYPPQRSSKKGIGIIGIGLIGIIS